MRIEVTYQECDWRNGTITKSVHVEIECEKEEQVSDTSVIKAVIEQAARDKSARLD